MKTIHSELKALKDNYFEGTINVYGDKEFSQYDTLTTIDYYTDDSYVSGDKDRQGKEKPFYNVVNAAVDLAVKATDFDTKDIILRPTKPQYKVQSMLLSKELRDWMRETNFAKTLNEFGETRPKYGGVILKKTERGGELKIDVVKWKNVITDQIDIHEGVIAEKHDMTQVQLSKKRGVWAGLDENWNDIMELFERDVKKKKDDQNETVNTITVYEVEGEFPETFMDENADEYEYSLQKHFIIDEGEKDQYILHSEEPKETQYKYLAWEEVAGRALGRGVTERGFQAQRWINDAKIKERDAMEIASKVVFVTTDDRIFENILTDLDNGDVISKKDGKEFSILNTTSNALPQFDNNVASWMSQFEKATSTFASVTGETMPSNTPLGSVQIQNQEARSLFDYKREQAGIFLKEVVEDWIMPFLLKQVRKAHDLHTQFSAEELLMIDDRYATTEVNRKVLDRLERGEVTTLEEYAEAIQAEKILLSEGGDRRFLAIPEKFYDDIETKVEVVTTNEQLNKAVAIQSLSEILRIVAQDPTVTQDPIKSKVFAEMVEMSGIGISSAELLSSIAAQQPTQGGKVNPQGLAEGVAEAQTEAPVTEEERALAGR